LFKDVLIALKLNSFTSNPYPVTLSIEMHCGREQQLVMAKYFREILVDIFIVEENDPPVNYPTLRELKNMFIIKVSR